MQPRLNLVTLGVADIAVSRAFYERLGFVASPASNEHVCFFKAGGVVLALFGHRALAEDAGVKDGRLPEFRGVSLAHNVASRAEVDAVIAEATQAGGKLVKKAIDVFWGGYSGYFVDPDDHLWEVAWNPFFPLDGEGIVRLP